MIKLKTHITADKREFTSKAGKLVKLTTVFVFLPNLPYPEKIDLFGEVPPAGVYDGVYKIDIYQGRLQLSPEYDKFSLSENK